MLEGEDGELIHRVELSPSILRFRVLILRLINHKRLQAYRFGKHSPFSSSIFLATVHRSVDAQLRHGGSCTRKLQRSDNDPIVGTKYGLKRCQAPRYSWVPFPMITSNTSAHRQGVVWAGTCATLKERVSLWLNINHFKSCGLVPSLLGSCTEILPDTSVLSVQGKRVIMF